MKKSKIFKNLTQQEHTEAFLNQPQIYKFIEDAPVYFSQGMNLQLETRWLDQLDITEWLTYKENNKVQLEKYGYGICLSDGVESIFMYLKREHVVEFLK